MRPSARRTPSTNSPSPPGPTSHCRPGETPASHLSTAQTTAPGNPSQGQPATATASASMVEGLYEVDYDLQDISYSILLPALGYCKRIYAAAPICGAAGAAPAPICFTPILPTILFCCCATLICRFFK